MSRSEENMKVDVMTMPSSNAIQLALDIYDSEPSAKDPKKLLNNTPINLTPQDPSKLSKKFNSNQLVDINLGELLGLGILGQFYEYHNKTLWDVILGLENTWKPHKEHVISDGALQESGKKSRMIVQQVMAQDFYKKENATLQEIIIQEIQKKELRRSDYPEKCVLLVNVYSPGAHLDFKYIMNNCKMDAFSLYFCIVYILPSLEQCLVIALDNRISPARFAKARITFKLIRYENPYGETRAATEE